MEVTPEMTEMLERFQDSRLTGGPVFMPERLQDIVRMFLRYYLENASWANLNADEKKICPSQTDFELIDRWAKLQPKHTPWPFPSAQYDMNGPNWPQPKAIEFDQEEHDRVIENVKQIVQDKKNAKALTKMQRK